MKTGYLKKQGKPLRRSWLKRGKPLKRGKKWLRKKTRDPRKALLRKADDLLQDYYRQEFAGTKCEGCGERFEVMHHFVLKSHSNRLRYEPLNLIYLCGACHSKVHGFHGEIVNAEIIMKRGYKWVKKIRELEREHINLGIKELEAIIKHYN